MRVASVSTVLPRHRYEQDVLIEAFQRLWGAEHHNRERVATLHRAVGVGARSLALPLAAYEKLRGLGDANAAFVEAATELGAQAVAAALRDAGLGPSDVDLLAFVTVTGVATPSIDARLVNRLGLRRDVKRLPIFGLGCVAGAAGVARVHDYLRGHPDQVAVLLSVELCSLTLQREDLSIANLIASGLFGDGAAAVVAVGEARAEEAAVPTAARDPEPAAAPPPARHRLSAAQAPHGSSDAPPPLAPRVIATRSVFYPDTEDAMGWDVRDSGFRVVLSPAVPGIVRNHVARDVDGFLAHHGLQRTDVKAWIAHPGGPRILEAFQQALDVPREALEITWRSLQDVGNLSSASVLFVLHDTLRERAFADGDHALLMAMGPGFCSELVLLRW